jgi:hypothetical protein
MYFVGNLAGTFIHIVYNIVAIILQLLIHLAYLTLITFHTFCKKYTFVET